MKSPPDPSLADQLPILPSEEQQEVIAFAKKLKSPSGKPVQQEERNRVWQEAADAFSRDDLLLMKREIAEGCKQIQPESW